MTETPFWKEYYRKVAADNASWLDFSNHRVQLQTLSLTLEAAGAIEGKTCLDAGCGRGQLSLLLRSFAPARLVAFDLVPEMEESFSAKAPDISILCGDASDAAFIQSLGAHDIVFCVEMLQYVSHQTVLPLLWRCVAPGGRLVIVVPNASCPIIQKANLRFEGRYRGAHLGELGDIMGSLPGAKLISWRPLAFQEDQTINPYEVGIWRSHFDGETSANRVQVVAVRD